MVGFERHLDDCGRCQQLIDAAPSTPSLDIAPVLTAGSTIGRYVILKLVGVGAIGAVYLAHDPMLDRRVAVKVLRTTELDVAARERLLREAKTLAKISHPNVVLVHDVGVAGPWVFIAMELVEGASLAAWCRARRRTRRDIVAMYAQAGLGLVAAHKAGVVHRDFRAENVLVDGEGRARVGDFGLARAVAAAPGDDATSAICVMVEELAGARVDERTDQFSFCASLYESLYGEPPFVGQETRDIAASLWGGTPRRLPTNALGRVLARGLASEPARRFPSMADLLARLAAVSSGRRRRIIAAGVIALAALTAFAMRATSETPDVCGGADDELAGAWGLTDRAAVGAAFSATALPYAPDTLAKVMARLDTYGARWVASHDRACRATRVQQAQTEDAMQLRINCLGDRRRELRSLVKLFGATDPGTVTHAVDAVSRLSDPDDCDDVAHLSAVDPPPDLATAARREVVRGRLAGLKALSATSRWDRVLADGTNVVAEARRDGDSSTLAAALLELARATRETRAWPAAEGLYLEAGWVAERAHDDHTRAAALVGNVLNSYYLHHDRALVIKSAEAVLARSPNVELEAHLQLNLGIVAEAESRFDDALVCYARAQELYGHILGPNAPQMLTLLANIADALGQRGDLVKALDVAQRAYDAAVTVLGPEHPDTAHMLFQVESQLSALHRFDEAYALALRVRDIDRKTIGEHNFGYGRLMGELAFLEGERKDHPAAIRYAEQALAIDRELGDKPGTMSMLVQLASDHLDLHHTADAMTLLREAIAMAEHDPDDKAEAGEVFSNAASILARAGNGSEAVPLAQRALALAKEMYEPSAPDFPEALRTLGMALVVAGRPAEAIVELERAMPLLDNTKDPAVGMEVRLFLAQALSATHRDLPRARAELTRAHDDAMRLHETDLITETEVWLRKLGATGTPRAVEPQHD